MKLIPPIAALALTACSALGPSIDESGASIRAYRGKPMTTLTAVLGYPDRQEKVMDATAYYWGEDQETGASCVWKAVAKDDGIIIDTSVFGNIWGCEQDTRRLQRAITNTP